MAPAVTMAPIELNVSIACNSAWGCYNWTTPTSGCAWLNPTCFDHWSPINITGTHSLTHSFTHSFILTNSLTQEYMTVLHRHIARMYLISVKLFVALSLSMWYNSVLAIPHPLLTGYLNSFNILTHSLTYLLTHSRTYSLGYYNGSV